MIITPTAIPDVLFVQPKVFGDERGFFFESFNEREFLEQSGLTLQFVQDNHSKSGKHVLRGLHYQIQHPQGKLVRVIAGEVLDVAVDIRKNSPTFGQSVSARLSATNHLQLWVPPGFAHGFMVLSDSAEFLYKTTDYWEPAYERCIRWDDPDLAIDWQLGGATPILSEKDKNGVPFAMAEVYP